MKTKIKITESQLKMLQESHRKKKHKAYKEPEFGKEDSMDDEFYSREDEINYGVEDDEKHEKDEKDEKDDINESILREFKRFL